MSFSYWEQQTFIGSPDVVVIGSGIVGLNAAIALKKKSPSLHVIVLERGMLPYGASTRNAGFACFGSVSELLEDLSKRSEDEVFELVEKRWNGLGQLREMIGDENLRYDPYGGFEVFTSDDNLLFDECSDAMDKFNRHLTVITGTSKTYKISDEKIKSFGFNNVKHLIENSSEGQVDTGRMMKSLLSLATSIGIEILNGANVTGIENVNDSVDVTLTDQINFSKTVIKAKRVLLCVNGFAKKFLPELDVNPARSQVFITSPIKKLKVKGAFHYDHGYYYFRNVGNRLMLGGGRNLDFKSETTEDMSLTFRIQERLEKLLFEMILPGEKYSIEMRWSGIMGLGNNKSPIIQKVNGNIFCAVRLGGMGVAIGTNTGREAADLVYNSL
jgi:gamma-glutamylputrescine oxidase